MLRILLVFIFGFIAINCEEANEFEQCGGLNFSEKDCAAGLLCKFLSKNYAMCLSPEFAEVLEEYNINNHQESSEDNYQEAPEDNYQESPEDNHEESGNKAPEFKLCIAGDDHKDQNTCSDGFRCEVLHPMFHLCLPFSADSDEVPHYGLCGGDNYSGSGKCAGDLICRNMFDYYSVCLAENEEYF